MTSESNGADRMWPETAAPALPAPAAAAAVQPPPPPAPPAELAAAMHQPTRWKRIRHRIVTPPAIYGTLLVSAIIGTSEDDDTDFDVLVTTVPTLLVFWVAHVFAEGISHYGKHGRENTTMRGALRHSVGHSSGLLYAGVVPCAFLVAGAVGGMQEALAYALALLFPVFLLGALGWFALADRGARWPAKLFAAWVTSSLGLFVILLKIAFH
ncbi:hypothetical protein [Subtercola boreus]|uniref:Uncharacterized protein n=1 Tax=Subtercola boreus TaxID=120213 RepID=A0A3E0WA69_9MICO|nr:hypothetical protein [Subtercola boreus]RFA19379.1 hypothetical protein B7R24_12100 [Subtercola boreus]RFA19640.1 hypothetical protein B7R23_12080 [Subtercola boreus]RFA26005.1 hypothetical protein B7R25_12200 [Subtercola boreus]